jgi:hypothetical protein
LNLCERDNLFDPNFGGSRIGPGGFIGNLSYPQISLSWANDVTFPISPEDPNERLYGAPLPVDQNQHVLMLEEWTYSEVGNPNSPLTATYWFHVVNARKEFPRIPSGGAVGQVLMVQQAPSQGQYQMPLIYWANP